MSGWETLFLQDRNSNEPTLYIDETKNGYSDTMHGTMESPPRESVNLTSIFGIAMSTFAPIFRYLGQDELDIRPKYNGTKV